MDLKEQITETYKIQAYSDNIIDCYYKIEHSGLKDYFKRTYNACKNFMNRLSAKKNDKPDKLLLDILSEEDLKDFDKYRIALDKAMDFCLNIHPYDYKKLDRIIDCSIEQNMVFMSVKDLKKLLLDSQLSGLPVEDFLKKKKLL